MMNYLKILGRKNEMIVNSEDIAPAPLEELILTTKLLNKLWSMDTKNHI